MPTILRDPEENVPTYQYVCTACGNQLEAVQSFSDAPLTECPSCEGRLRKVFNSVGIVFKGSGFYRTDSRGNGSDSSSGGATAAKSTSGGESSSSNGGGSTAGTNGSGNGGGSSTKSETASAKPAASTASSGSTSSSGS
ncbi:FmdB family zinc ribbon protein [Micromonospora sp. NPDC049559]|uniref:FmdB family zinc ribbon protein n=1 Tax=Micromonospora sp. NPDC049559 TaxID=3155923 RepID=UPI00343AE6C9